MPSDDYEMSFWGDAGNTFHEEQKQIVYATRMGLRPIWDCAHPPSFDLEGRSVLDIGGGPVSLLLKCTNRGRCKVIDPAPFPKWVWRRYQDCGIGYAIEKAEAIMADLDGEFDEAWIYNVLQHVDEPALVIAKARSVSRAVRIFEWIEVDPYPGHPHRLEREQLDEWLGGAGFTARLNEHGAVGLAYYGVFAAANVQ